MKRTLLVSAFAVMALAASAQISEVTKVKGDVKGTERSVYKALCLNIG